MGSISPALMYLIIAYERIFRSFLTFCHTNNTTVHVHGHVLFQHVGICVGSIPGSEAVKGPESFTH